MTNHTPNKENNAYKWANNKMPNKIASTIANFDLPIVLNIILYLFLLL